MARLWQSGFELNSQTAGVEFTAIPSVNSVIQTTTVRTGTYAGECTATALGNGTPVGWSFQFASVASNGPYFARGYFRYATLPGTACVIMILSSLTTLATTGNDSAIYINTDGTLQFQDNNGTASGNSAVLSANTWYRLEMKMDVGNSLCTALLNGTQFGTSSVAVAVRSFGVGGNIDNGVNLSGHWYWDDLAVNDNTGASQTSFPGAGGITHLQPNAAGDNNSFTVAVGGTAGSTNNYTRVKEITPDDATSYNGGVLNTDIDDFAMTATPAGIKTNDTINVVMVGVRFNAAVAAAEASFKARIKKVTGGTVASSAAITPNSTTWKTNANAVPNLYPIIEYNNPDGAAWTKALLDTAQVGYNISTTNTNAANISTVWVSIDSTPGVTVNTGNFFPFFGFR